MKRLLSIVLALALVLCLVPSAFAASDEAYQSAYSLYHLGLFKGVGTKSDGSVDFGLDRTPTRHEAVTMLVRLLGKEKEATAGTWQTPFTDVADWAAPYVGYAYANGLTNGTSATTFDGDALIDANQYLTFVLRALGYTSGVDFQWNEALETAVNWLGLTYDLVDSPFTRGDVAVLSTHALDAFSKGSGEKLGYELFENYVPNPFTVPTADPWLKIYYTEKAPALDVVASYGNQDAFSRSLTLAPLAPVTNLRIMGMDYGSSIPGNFLYTSETLLEVGSVAPGQAVEINFSIPEFYSTYAVAYIDQDQVGHVFYLTESGYDGSYRASQDGIDQFVLDTTPNIECPKCHYTLFITGLGNDGLDCPQCGCNYMPCQNCGVCAPMEEMIGYLCENCWDQATPSPLFSNRDAVVKTGFHFSNDEASWKVPEVNSTLQDAESINAQIIENLEPIINEELSDILQGYSPFAFLIDYDIIWHDTFFTLIPFVEYPSDNRTYYVHNIDLMEGRQIANAALLKWAGMTEEEFIRRAKRSATNSFERNIPDFASDEELQFRREEQAKYNEQFIHVDMPMFFNEDDQLTIITPISSFAGADAYDRFIVVE